jgi:hypothetical protein
VNPFDPSGGDGNLGRAFIIQLRCMTCSQFVAPADVVRIGESVIQCWNCYDKQRTIIESFQDPPKECVRCHASFEDLAAQVPGKPVSMFPHWIDGTFGFLCVACDQVYVQQRRDMYGDTRFGWDRKLK